MYSSMESASKIAVATSDGAISAAPLTSAGLSGSVGSAASRSHSTRSADCARAGDCGAVSGSADRANRRAIKTAPDGLVMTPILSRSASGAHRGRAHQTGFSLRMVNRRIRRRSAALKSVRACRGAAVVPHQEVVRPPDMSHRSLPTHRDTLT